MTKDERNALLETVAQMLYDRAEVSDSWVDRAILDEMKRKYEVEVQTYCAAAELVRSLKE